MLKRASFLQWVLRQGDIAIIITNSSNGQYNSAVLEVYVHCVPCFCDW